MDFDVAIDSDDEPTRVERRRPRVLVVDDDESIRRLVDRALTWYGYRVEVAPDVEQAIRVACAWRPQVIIVDRWLHDGDGLELVLRVRAELGLDAPRTIVCCTSDDVPGWTLLRKPFHLRELVESVREQARANQVSWMHGEGRSIA